MILICPLCKSRYLVAASHFAAGPRSVRCAKCMHSWEAAADPAEGMAAAPAVPVADLTPPPEDVIPVPRGSSLPVIQKARFFTEARNIGYVVALCAVLLVAIFVFNRENNAKQWPFLEPLYRHIGLHIYEAGNGLKIVNVHSELQNDAGMMRLVVEGKITNPTHATQDIPAILAAAVGSGGDIIQSWQIDPPAATLQVGETVPFSSTIKSPRATIVQINLNFVEPNHDSE